CHTGGQFGEDCRKRVDFSASNCAGFEPAAGKLLRVIAIVLANTDDIPPRTGYRCEQLYFAQRNACTWPQLCPDLFKAFDKGGHAGVLERKDLIPLDDPNTNSTPLLIGRQLHIRLYGVPITSFITNWSRGCQPIPGPSLLHRPNWSMLRRRRN